MHMIWPSRSFCPHRFALVKMRRKQEHEAESLIRRALGDRAKLVRALGRRLAPGQPLLRVLAAGLPDLEAAGQLLVGAQLDAAQALRRVAWELAEPIYW